MPKVFLLSIYIAIPKQKQPGCKKVQGQSEARLQVTKTSDIKEGQENKLKHFLFLNNINQDSR